MSMSLAINYFPVGCTNTQLIIAPKIVKGLIEQEDSIVASTDIHSF